MSTPRTSLTIIGRAAVALSIAAGGTLLTAAPAMAQSSRAVHAAYGDDPYGQGGDPSGQNETPYETTTTTVAPTTTTTTSEAAPVAPPAQDPVVEGAGATADPATAVAPAPETAPQSLDSLPRTGRPARTQAFFALMLMGFGSVLRLATRKPAKAKA